MIQDEELLFELRNNVNRGYSLLVDNYVGLVYTIVNNKLHGACSKEDIEEVVSDIFYQFYMNNAKVDLTKGNIKAYISVIAKRRAINRYVQTIKNAPDISLDDSFENIIASGNSVDEDVSAKETKKELIDCILNLGPPDNEIILRKFYLGQTIKDIARDINCKSDTVKKRYERALKKLRFQLGGGCYAE